MSSYADGSGSESDPDQPKAYGDNASAGRPSLADLRRNSRTQRIIDDPRWRYSTGDPADFQERVLAPQYRFAEGGQRHVPTSPASDTSSMALTGDSRSTYYSSSGSSGTPSLTGSVSTRRDSRSSAYTDSVGSVPNHYRLEEDDDGIPQVPDSRRGTLQCPWSPLGCDEWFNGPSEWEIHYQAHFRGHLPRSIECPFQGCSDIFRSEHSQDTWRARWNHMIGCRYRTNGVKTRISRSLIDHLWRKGLISGAEEQALRQTGSLSTAGAYLESNSGSRDRRRERRPEDYRSPRNGGHGSGNSYLPRR